MRRWIFTSDGEWWIDRDPPPDDDRATEVEVGNEDDEVVVEVTPVFSGRQVVRRALGRTPDLADLRALLAEHMHAGFRAISVGEQRAKLEDLIDGGRMRAWRRRRRRIGSSGGAGFMEGVETPPPSRLPSDSHDPRPPGPSSPAQSSSNGAVPPPDDTLSWYEFVLLDELDTGVADVLVEMTTPRGTAWKTTDASGVLRIDQAPPGVGFARVDAGSLALALQDRAKRPRRRSRPPDTAADFERFPPGRLPPVFRFPDARPHRVMVVSRTDVSVAGSDPAWSALAPDPASRLVCRIDAAVPEALALCSRGIGEGGRIKGRPPADASADAMRAFPDVTDLSGAVLDDLIPQPEAWPAAAQDAAGPWFEGGLDDIHHALWDGAGDGLFDLLARPLVRAPSPSQPPADPPLSAQEEAARQALIVSSALGVDPASMFIPPGDGDDPETEPVPDQPPPPSS